MDDTGFDRMPDRYQTESGREKIDLIRDAMSDAEFAAFCLGNALKYDDRGKGEHDPEKARWYREMRAHVLTGSPDPRHKRPGFAPYQRASLPQPLPGRRIDVLDHGFVRLVETWGGGDSRMPEAGIVEAARQSTQGSFRGWRRDARLLRYLHQNKHSTPFEFAGMVIEVRAPLFVFREWHRHRTQSYNEMSARYAPLPDLNYLPTWEEVHRRSHERDEKNRQAGKLDGAPAITPSAASRFVENLRAIYEGFEIEYQGALKEGVPKELARCGMPVGRYSQMRASAVLRNWLAFLTLRLDPAAQWEIRQYAHAVHQLVVENFPHTAALWTEGHPHIS